MTEETPQESLSEPELLAQVIEPTRRSVPVLDVVRIRSEWADFEVEEIPVYLPEGSGEHLYLWIEKQGLSTGQCVDQFARQLNISARDIGVAGQKDRHAVTRQWISIPRSAEANLTSVSIDNVSVMSIQAHRNKLKTGHLKGNRFRLILRTDLKVTGTDIVDQVRKRLQDLESSGYPAYFGSQRFGNHGSTLREGLELLSGLRRPRRSASGGNLTRLALSAVQSAHFNLVTAERVEQETVGQVLSGDVVIRRGGTRPFLFEGELPAPIEFLPAGPMWGPKMTSTAGRVFDSEKLHLSRLGLDGVEFEAFGKLCEGTRRPMLEFPSCVKAEPVPQDDSAICITFELNSGMYATTLLRELATTVIDAAVMPSTWQSTHHAPP